MLDQIDIEDIVIIAKDAGKAVMKIYNQDFGVEYKTDSSPLTIADKLANEIIERFHNKGAATRAKEDFITKFQKNKIPDQVPEVTIRVDHQMPLPNVLKIAGLVQSSSEGMRMIKQGGVKIDGAKVTSTETVIEKGSTVVLQVGKRKFAKTSLI